MTRLASRHADVYTLCGPIESRVERHYDEVTTALESALAASPADAPFLTNQFSAEYPRARHDLRAASWYAPARRERPRVLDVAETTLRFGLSLGSAAMALASPDQPKLPHIELERLTVLATADHVRRQPAVWFMLRRFSEVIDPSGEHEYAMQNVMGGVLQLMEEAVEPPRRDTPWIGRAGIAKGLK